MKSSIMKCSRNFRRTSIVATSCVWFLWTGLQDLRATTAYGPPVLSSMASLIGDTLPVVIHVMHTGTPVGSPDNPSDSLLLEMLGLLNAAYNKDGPNFGGADVGIFFQRAHRAPDCVSSTGIRRVDASGVPKYATGGITFDTFGYPNSAYELYVKELSRWPNTDYINIWIVNMIDGDPNVPGGYSWFPEYNSALLDGIVVQASVVNGTNKTLIHEMGHTFYLYHTFGDAWVDCIADTDCLEDGDHICDTENCRYTLNCLDTINPCSGEAWLIADTLHGYTVLNNHMGYTDCAWMFTEGQKARIQYALNTFRPGLLSSWALSLSTDSPPTAACIPTATNGFSPYYGIERVELGNLEVYSNTSEADGAFYIDRTCNQRVVVSVADSVFLRITGSYENYQQIRVYCDLNNNGTFDLPEELLLSQDGGIVEDTLLIPASATLCTPLRLRVVSELPGAPEPTPCHITGNGMDGVGQIEDYTMIVLPRAVISLTSGDWDDPAIWSCGCVPGLSDAVTICASHSVVVTQAMGVITCASVLMENTAELHVVGEIRVSEGCGY